MSAAGQARKLAGKPTAPKKPAAKPTRVRPVAAERASPLGIIGIVVAAGALLGLSAPTFLIAVIGMAPTVVSYLFETGNARRALPCMVALNIAGVAPVVNMLLGHSSSLSFAFGLLRDPYIWLLMYGSAGAAFALLWVAPRLAQAVIDARAREQRAKLVSAQEQLVAEWGAEVAQPGIASAPRKPPGE